jgi:hypothetical protein
MSGFLTGPELSRDAVNGRWLGLCDVFVAHAPRRLNSKATGRLIVDILSILFFMHQATLRD